MQPVVLGSVPSTVWYHPSPMSPSAFAVSSLALTLRMLLPGPDHLCALFGHALDAIASSGEQSDVTAAAKGQMALHQDFFYSLRTRIRGMGPGCRCGVLCEHAMQAKLPGFERMTGILHTTLTAAQRILVQPLNLDIVPTEVSLGRWCRKLELAQALGLNICVADHRAVERVLGEWKQWKDTNIVPPEAQERRLRSFAEYREGLLAFDNASLLVSASQPASSLSTVRVLLDCDVTAEGAADALRKVVVGALNAVQAEVEGASMAHVVRVEPLYHEQDTKKELVWFPSQTLVHVACSLGSVAAVQAAMLGLPEHPAAWAEELQTESSYVQVESPSLSWMVYRHCKDISFGSGVGH